MPLPYQGSECKHFMKSPRRRKNSIIVVLNPGENPNFFYIKLILSRHLNEAYPDVQIEDITLAYDVKLLTALGRQLCSPYMYEYTVMHSYV